VQERRAQFSELGVEKAIEKARSSAGLLCAAMRASAIREVDVKIETRCRRHMGAISAFLEVELDNDAGFEHDLSRVKGFVELLLICDMWSQILELSISIILFSPKY
jgi:hypothetical protein